jgi:hypothetical protein
MSGILIETVIVGVFAFKDISNIWHINNNAAKIDPKNQKIVEILGIASIEIKADKIEDIPISDSTFIASMALCESNFCPLLLSLVL